MSKPATPLATPVTRLIRADHARMLAAFQRYESDAPEAFKRSIAERVCRNLEVHAALEEEIFYPALREVIPGNPALAKTAPEHDEMRRLVDAVRAALRAPVATARRDRPDLRFMTLMRIVIHHVADEETELLPAAEQLMPAARLLELGARMNRRRLELEGPDLHGRTLAALRVLPASRMLATTGGVLLGSYLIRRAWMRSHRPI